MSRIVHDLGPIFLSQTDLPHRVLGRIDREGGAMHTMSLTEKRHDTNVVIIMMGTASHFKGI